MILSCLVNVLPACAAICSPELLPIKKQDTLSLYVYINNVFADWQAFGPAVEPSLMSKHTVVNNRLQLLQLSHPCMVTQK